MIATSASAPIEYFTPVLTHSPAFLSISISFTEVLQEIMIEANTNTNVIFFMICVFLKLFNFFQI
tara:strand:- start:1735 stop:1929 length:195 start_codon:yes stop_codon:yes gene_type:complete